MAEEPEASTKKMVTTPWRCWYRLMCKSSARICIRLRCLLTEGSFTLDSAWRIVCHGTAARMVFSKSKRFPPLGNPRHDSAGRPEFAFFCNWPNWPLDPCLLFARPNPALNCANAFGGIPARIASMSNSSKSSALGSSLFSFS